MGKNDKNKNKYPQVSSDIFGVGAVRFGTNAGGGTGNTGSCGVNVSCVLCCCVGSGGGAENKKIQVRV